MKLDPEEYVLDWMVCPFCATPMILATIQGPVWYCKQCKREVSAKSEPHDDWIRRNSYREPLK